VGIWVKEIEAGLSQAGNLERVFCAAGEWRRCRCEMIAGQRWIIAGASLLLHSPALMAKIASVVATMAAWRSVAEFL
jgi:hypothetical protein